MALPYHLPFLPSTLPPSVVRIFLLIVSLCKWPLLLSLEAKTNSLSQVSSFCCLSSSMTCFDSAISCLSFIFISLDLICQTPFSKSISAHLASAVLPARFGTNSCKYKALLVLNSPL